MVLVCYQGDSGGPLTVKNGTSSQHTLAGITSWIPRMIQGIITVRYDHDYNGEDKEFFGSHDTSALKEIRPLNENSILIMLSSQLTRKVKKT